MSTIKAFIRVSAKRKQDFDVAVRFRISDGRGVQLFYTSGIFVDPKVWDCKNECIKAKVLYSNIERTKFDNSVADMKKLLRSVYDDAPNKESLTSDDLVTLVDMRLHPEKYNLERDNRDFFKEFDRYLQSKELTEGTRRHYEVVYRSLKRFEQFKAIKSAAAFKLGFDSFDIALLKEYAAFLQNEHRFTDRPIFKPIYGAMPKRNIPEERGTNTLNNLLKKLRAFFKWAAKEKIAKDDPFLKFTISEQEYGTPYYITIEERNRIADADLAALWETASDEIKSRIPKSHIPQLKIQRDIFVFQCCVGCRVGDLYSLTPEKVEGESISYIARKTKKRDARTIVVPLNSRATEILSRYYDGQRTDGALFPFIAQQRYNDAIKEIFTLVGITRMVVTIDPITGNEVHRPINELASSHMARRTFVGNAYKKFKDPNLIGSMSGHVEGSRAFARYRDIDMDIKKEVVKELE